MGIELLKNSVNGILHPEPLTFSWIPFIILIVSILMKGWLYFFYNRIGKKIDSSTLLAAAKDSVSDVLATSAVALSMLVGHLTGWMISKSWMTCSPIMRPRVVKSGRFGRKLKGAES